MYRWLRNAHLFIGLFSSLFIIMFGVTAVRFSHESWFSDHPKIIEERFTILPESAVSARAVAQELMDKHGFRGDVAELGKPSVDGFHFRIARPGTASEVNYSRATGEVRVQTRGASFMGMLAQIHDTYGLWHDYPLLNVWALLLGLVSVGLMVLAGTGIYLWFKIHQERKVGTILLAISLGYSLTLVFLLSVA